jgi:hypothetical protein
MRADLAILALLAIGLGDGPVVAQTPASLDQPMARPDFSGVWTMDNSRSESAAQEQPAGTVTATISQTDSVLTVKTDRDGQTDTRVYPIGPAPATMSQISGVLRAYWDGGRLVDEGAVSIEGQTIAFQESRTPAANGLEMVVETTLKVEHGYLLRGAQTIVTGKNVYTRSRAR